MIINKKNYILNIEKIFEFVFSDDERIKDSEIVETYIEDETTNNLVLANKQLRELKGGDNSSKQTLRYDMIKMYIDILSEYEAGHPTLIENMIFDTMIANEFIIELNK